MVVDRLGTAILRGLLRALPAASREEYAGEILEMNRRRRAALSGLGEVTRFWVREIVAGALHVASARTDRVRPRAQRTRAGGALVADVRFAVRAIRRRPAVPALVVTTLAVSIGAVLAIFAMVDGLLLDPIPVPGGDRVVRVFDAGDEERPYGRASFPLLQDYRRTGAVDGPAGWMSIEAGLRAGELSDRVSVGVVTGDFFEILRVTPAEGRLLQPADDREEASPAVVLSHARWRDSFGADPAVVGSSVEISGTAFTVAGVAPAWFRGASLETAPDLWAPLARLQAIASSGLYANPNVFEVRAFGWLSMVARLPGDISVERAAAELDAAARAAAAEAGEVIGLPGSVVRLQTLSESAWIQPDLASTATARDRQRGAMLQFVTLLAGVVVLVLVIACLNASLLMAMRGWTRDLEFGVRQALGAGRGRLLRHLLAECLLVALGGAGLGLALASGATALLRGYLLPGGISLDRLDMALDTRLAAAAVALALLSTAMFGLAPALRHSRRDVGERLRRNGRSVAGSGRGIHASIFAQVALSLVLVVGALLFLRALSTALNVPLGFEPDGVAALSFAFQGHGYDAEQTSAAVAQIVAAAEDAPGIESAAITTHVPLSPVRMQLRPVPEGAAEDRAAVAVPLNSVSRGYFRTLGIPLVAGRDFDATDVLESAKVAILNRAAASLLFPDADALGRSFVLVRGLTPLRVVGIVADHKVHAVNEDPVPYVYINALQNAGVGIATGAHLVARSTSTAGNGLDVLRNVMREFDAALPTYDARLIDAQMRRVLMPQRFGAMLLGLLAAIALVIAAIGIHATLAFAVGRRTREIGIRMALGAQGPHVVATILARIGRVVAAGVIVGLGLAMALSGFVESYLYEVEPIDPQAFQGGALLLLTVVVIAVWRPARRAVRVDPTSAIGQAD